MTTNQGMPNRLAKEKSPYLLQHAYNPVNWYPWGPEAFEKSKSEDKPIFLSIGYSTCHWCHVMERECFEDEEVAAELNRGFVSIKVDREERPDVDHIYMTVCQALTGHGGWPLSIFMTPDRKPFFAGTYYPKHDRMGMTGFLSLLKRIGDAWKSKKQALMDSGAKIIEAISSPDTAYKQEIPENTIHMAFEDFRQDFDSIYGGFGGAPKFPTPHNLIFLTRYSHLTGSKEALDMVEKTLEAMQSGGIYDHIGFGFSRYSTDRKWLVPHFEKMLYDNALLAIAYLEAFHAIRNQAFAETARQIFTYVLRDMTSEEGGFYSAEDADSEGEEGKFYVWTPKEVKEVLGNEDGEKFCRLYDITEDGNFEGCSIPNLTKKRLTPEDRDFAENCKKLLFERREKRVHPYKDDKILTAWNGLMIAALAAGGRILGRQEYTLAAEKAAGFILTHLLDKNGRLLARYRDKEAAYPGYADDYAFFIWGLLELYQTTYKPQYLKKALDLNTDFLRLFWDEEDGGLFLYGTDSEELIARPKEVYDGATPSGNSAAALNLLRLARLTGDSRLEEKADSLFKAFGSFLVNIPRGHSFLLSAYMYAVSPAKEVVLVGGRDNSQTSEMLQVLKEKYLPFTLSLLRSDNSEQLLELAPYLADYKAIEGKATAYVCRNYSCQAPVTSSSQFKDLLN